MKRVWIAGALLLLAAGVEGAPGLDLAVTLDPGTRRLEVVAELPVSGRSFEFELHESLTVSEATAAGHTLLPADATSRRRGDPHANTRLWRIALPAGATGLRLTYAGTLPATELSRDHRQVLLGLPPMAAPEGSFLPAGSAWYPQPSGALFGYRVRLSVPGEQRALVAGRLLDERLPTSAGDRYRAEFEFPQPTDGIDLMAGPWRVRERLVAREGAPALRLRSYFPADIDDEPGLAEGYLADSERYIARYSRLIGAYPYDAFSIVASPLPTGFGMPTLTYLGVEVLRLPFIRATSLGHEILHNWWGNGVHADARGGNWSEGLTTFLADYAYSEDRSAAAGRDMRLGWLRDAAALPAADQPALHDFRSRRHGADEAIGYGKAAMLFLMLRDRIGEAAFRQGLRDFWQAQRFRRANWDDLRRAFERASGADLRAFFAQWLNSRQLPEVALVDAVVSRYATGYRLRLTLRQESPPLALRLPVEIAAGERRVVRWVELDGARTLAEIDLDFRPERLRLDPEARVWRRLDVAERPPILRRWVGAPKPRWVVVGGDAAFREAAQIVAGRFFERPATPLGLPDVKAALAADESVLLIGTPSEIDVALAVIGLPKQAEALGENGGRGSARVWTIASGPLLAVAAADAAALVALARPLPHYGGQSWLVFDGGRVIERGLWPAQAPVISVRSEKHDQDRSNSPASWSPKACVSTSHPSRASSEQ
ncbi:putative aminopeptidase [Candidatus Accumulibacter aalborgensis]|uniref:Putative aminopeptidase n=1 Tax=Candidatus Accumulibacter aalborgensis TaxID=1860102 RepID=A0A1A8XT99_9PROT|nr:M1 family aminopeptidase [Candidatus Accumulibacter aalborgensis]SBT08295.1 putative aminopeptidase [Candidatus Accumulibacter aalborgensis]